MIGSMSDRPALSASDLAAVKERLVATVDEHAEALVAASHAIHARPELAFDEHFAHDTLADLLDAAGLDVTRSAYGLDTAFEATAGPADGPTIAVMCEYDALPGIGHACGHNIIGTAGVGAGIAAATVAAELGGRVVVLGTPAEEGGGGKVMMMDQGCLDGIDAALMVHPAGRELASMHAIAIHQVIATYHGKANHAAAAPEKGLNALDGAVLGYMNIAALRQHIAATERIHGVFTDGGGKPNIVPARAEAHWYVRAANLSSLEVLKGRVSAALEAGAVAAGVECEQVWIDPAYADMIDNAALVDAYSANARVVGREVQVPSQDELVIGSTDMGNVSYAVPAIHPMIKVAPFDCAIHTDRFATFTGGPEGDAAVIDGAKIMAMTVADLWAQPGLLEKVADEFEMMANPAGSNT